MSAPTVATISVIVTMSRYLVCYTSVKHPTSYDVVMCGSAPGNLIRVLRRERQDAAATIATLRFIMR